MVEQALGHGMKEPADSEANTRQVVRRSLAAMVDLEKGQVLTANVITQLRPGTGIPPTLTAQVVGRTLKRSVRSGELLDWSHIGTCQFDSASADIAAALRIDPMSQTAILQRDLLDAEAQRSLDASLVVDADSDLTGDGHAFGNFVGGGGNDAIYDNTARAAFANFGVRPQTFTGYDFGCGNAHEVRSIVITAGPRLTDPSSNEWWLDFSDDGIEWTRVDKRLIFESSQGSGADELHKIQVLNFPSSGDHRFWRLIMEEVGSIGDPLSFEEIEFRAGPTMLSEVADLEYGPAES